jgi:hypothetical protein
MPDTLSDAKASLAHANKAFPTSVAAAQAPKAAVAAAATPAPSIGQELAVKKIMVDKARSALPKLHKGGPVPADGAYQLKAGEHVLTAPEAAKARTHAMLASGMKSLAKPAPARKGNASIGAIDPMPAKPKTTTDTNLDTGFGVGGANGVSTSGAKPGGSIKPEINATPKMKLPVSGLTKT